nr:hypothetical protein [Amnibacterium kyonggiense]
MQHRMSDEDDDAFGPDPATEPSTPTAGAARTLSTYYGSADEWFRRYWRYTYRRRVSPAAPAPAAGLPSGGTTTKPPNASKRSGEPGKPAAKTPAPA